MDTVTILQVASSVAVMFCGVAVGLRQWFATIGWASAASFAVMWASEVEKCVM